MKTKISLSTCLMFCLFAITAVAQSPNAWQIEYSKTAAFIENKGQFDLPASYCNASDVEYACDQTNLFYFFSKNGLAIELTSKHKVEKSEQEKAEREQRKTQPFNSLKEWQDFENAGNRIEFERDLVYATWVGANPDVELIAENPNTAYHSYSYYDENRNVLSVENVSAFNKLIYKNLYPNIDVVYEFHPQGGIKYSVIVHPGGDISQVRLQYSKDISLLPDGTVHTPTKHGDIIDHAPVTFYEGAESTILNSNYVVNGNEISFYVENHDPSKTLVIDPWTQTPTFATNWDCVWECEKDAVGNVYIIGGVMPLQLLKYNSGGTLQWTYNTPYDTTMWLGTFATDNAGNSYVTNGSTAMIQKVSTAGGLVWNNSSPGGLFSSTELWNISFNCDQTKLVVGGTGGFLPPLPYIYNIDMSNGNVLSSVQVTGSQLFPGPHEVRSIVACENEKYYWMTHDSIGYVSDDLTLCPTFGGTPFHIGTGYGMNYKNENWRYNNSGIEALAYYDGFVYVNRGNQVHKRDFNTGAVVATATIPGGGWASIFLGGNQVQNSGIDVDDCGNVYVGSKNQVIKYDANLNQLATYATSFNVYDVQVSSGGEIIASGSTGTDGSSSRSGYIQQITAGACAPTTMVCCNPYVCPPADLCTTDAPITLTPETPGGTWSGPAGLNTSTGVFNPAVSGPGTFTITYTLVCGTHTFDITVSDCSVLTICEETNGTFTVSGGTGPYTWANWQATTTTSNDCVTCGGTVIFGFCTGATLPCTIATTGYVNFATGTNASLPGGATQVQITDGTGTTLVFDPSTVAPCSSTCDPTITPAGPFCVTDAAVNLVAAETGGTWSGTGITNASLGTFNPATAGAGTFTITYTGTCGLTDTETITVNAATTPTFAAVGPICSGAALAPLPTTSTNGINGTWSPAINNTATTTYTFTPTAGQCATTTTLTITVNANVTPTFTAVSPICSGAALAPLPTTSTNGINGTWSPAINNTATTTYTFTPTAGQCATTTTLTITVNANVTPTFTAVGPICSGAALAPLPTTSTNGITGTWSPAINNTATTTYTFTPTAGQCATTTTLTVTVNAADDASFTYPAGSYCPSDPDPSPTITGLLGGTFSITAPGVINASSGIIDLSASGISSYTVTYTTTGSCPSSETFALSITTSADATITPAGPFCEDDAAVNLTAVDAGGTWSGTGITDATNGTFDPAVAGSGTFTITYTISGACGASDTETITVNALEDATFNYASGSYCVSDPNPTPTISGTPGGTFTISAPGVINASTGQINIAGSGTGTFTITYTTSGTCSATSTATVTITTGADATITPAGPFCSNDPVVNLISVDAGGTWSGTGITDAVNGTFDPAVAGAGTFTITYTISGGCGDTDTETITVNAAGDASFSYSAALYCTTDPNPTPTISGTSGGTFTISAPGVINATTGQIDIASSGTGSFTITYNTGGACAATSTQNITITSGANATITPAGPFCANAAAVNLVAVDPGGTWSGTGITDAVNGTFDPATAGPGTHTITYTISGSCGAADTETITVNAVDNASFSYTGSPFCVSGVDPLATVTGTPGGTFTITAPGVINVSNGTIDLSASGAGTFTITYNTGGTCPASSTASVTIISTANTTITAAGPFCEDDPSTTLVAATPGGTWSGPGITNAATGQFDPGVAGAGTHTITYTISGSCGGSSTTTIVVNPFESATISYAASSFCSSDADPFPTIMGTIGGTFTIDNGGVINSTTGIIDISASGTGTFTVTYTTGGVCFDVSTFNITISPSLTASVVDAGPFCLGDAEVTLNGSPGGGTWSGDGIIDTSLGIFNPDSAGAGTHEIIYTLAGTCGDEDTIEILVSGPPSAWVSNDTTIFIGDEAQLFAGGGTSYFWYEDQDISCTDCQNPEVDPLNTTTYCAIVYNSYGCADTACVTITVDQNCGDVFIPNAFSPDDNGENNMECVYGRCIATMTFTIYDRWGEKVFVTESQDVCWDGMYKGKPMNTGVYVYIFEATLLTGEVVEKKGNITLVR
ncbi:MAG: gliding motility-associated C-terminal domain-containing protein [Crocinitomicaceae bacterium]|nr:gliding motility-associated C-terminal domain-containing protein [Crocinitomicaceae bacterium]MBK8925170.1 gliding motility-associated C-terminal domain-containing protein [Crocinitomicaceae bacterium]